MMLVIFGGALGALARYVLQSAMQDESRALVWTNNIGSMLFGWLVALAVREPLYLAFGIGFCGAFTTFSTVFVQLAQQWRAKQYALFFSFLMKSTLEGFLFATLGYFIGIL
ncbi:CrcB family protein [Savagea sp. SN6]|uniref:Fluoride-specific ion channel FluC n=1 Tax=Savagea serpentis TaxID=2785297 RepID=A0A8J7G3C5_9BACL|nr:CrcB family protein [Savagea serpentis]MBF4500657.1 CrcB family protein [Savagea serpentis]